MALDYIGVSVSYDRITAILKTEWFRTITSRILALEQLGVRIVYKQGTLEELRNHLLNKLPPIAFVATRELSYWNSDEKHAVVVVGIDDAYVYLNDPAFPNAPIPVTLGDFDLAWLEWDELYAVFMKRS